MVFSRAVCAGTIEFVHLDMPGAAAKADGFIFGPLSATIGHEVHISMAQQRVVLSIDEDVRRSQLMAERFFDGVVLGF